MDETLLHVSSRSFSGGFGILGGDGDAGFVGLLLRNKRSSGVRGGFDGDRCLSSAFASGLIDFFRCFCLDRRSERFVSQSNSVSSGLVIFAFFFAAVFDLLNGREDRRQ